MEAFHETVTSEGLDAYLAPLEHWTYQTDNPLRPVHEILGATPAASPEAPEPPGTWEADESMRGSRTLEALEALENLDEEYEDLDTEQGPAGWERLEREAGEDEDEDLEDEDEDLEDRDGHDPTRGETGYEELGGLPTAERGRPREVHRREELEEEDLEDEELDEVAHEELVGTRVGRALGAGRIGGPRRRRIFLHRGDTVVIKWR